MYLVSPALQAPDRECADLVLAPANPLHTNALRTSAHYSTVHGMR